VLALAALAALAGLGLATRHSHHGGATTTGAATAGAAPRPKPLDPPPPIPGYLLIADRGNDRMLLVDAKKRIFWRYPRPGTSPAMPFRFDDDTFFGPSHTEIISNQEDQHTIQIISFPGGRVLWRYGHTNVLGSAPGYLHTPDDAYLLEDGLVSVADAYNCRVLFIDRAHRTVRSYGRAGDCRHDPPQALGAVNGATPLPDGGTLVSEIDGSWVDDIGPNGKLRWAVQAPVSYPSDPQLLAPGRILLADYARPGHALIIDTHGRVLWRYGPSSGPGELDHPSLAFRIAPGLVAINDDYRDRVVIVDIHTNRIVWQYGHTDRPGRAPGYLNTPDGLDLLPTAAAQRLPAIRAVLAVRRPHRRAPAAPRTAASAAVGVRTAAFRLPAPVQRAVAVPDGRTILVGGGLDASGTSTSGIFRLDPVSGRLRALGSVPQPFHDAAAGLIGGALYVFGGGAAASSAAVQRFDLRTRRGAVVAHLPRPLSDLGAATIGGTVYLVGGYDDVSPQRAIYATTDGVHVRVAGMLPTGLRYPAVAAAGGRLVIAGGAGPGGPTDAVLAFDPSTGRVRRIGSLPTPVAHAAAVASGGAVYVVGGIDGAGRTLSTVTRIASAGVRRGPAASTPVADAAVATVGATSYLIGGRDGGRTLASVLAVARR
jgi:outer membrane protein assembly factor BamB